MGDWVKVMEITRISHWPSNVDDQKRQRNIPKKFYSFLKFRKVTKYHGGPFNCA